MNSPFRRLLSFALLALLAGLPHALRARDLPTCDFVVDNPDPPSLVGGPGCHVDARLSGPRDRHGDRIDIELAPHEEGTSFDVIIDQRRLRLLDGSDWFRVLELRTHDSERDLGWLWWVEVANGPSYSVPQVRIVPLLQTSSTARPIALEEPVYLSATGLCTRITGLWETREDGGHAYTQLSLHSSIPYGCESPDGDTGQPQTLVYWDIGIPLRLSLGAIDPAHGASLNRQGFVRLNLFDPIP